ncbi:hypothetical protein [Limnohabitans sp. Rim8]
MSFWNFWGRLAFSGEGEIIQRMRDMTSVSSKGTIYTNMGNHTF